MLLECVTVMCLANSMDSETYSSYPYQEDRRITRIAEATETLLIELEAEEQRAAEERARAEAEAQAAQQVASQVTNVWHRLAVCESGMNGEPRWDYNGSSGFHGGIQFHPGTWSSYKPSGYPSAAWQATPEQQIAVGRLVAASQGAGAWPSCTAKLGISTQDLINN